MKHLGSFSGPNAANKSVFWRPDFREKNQMNAESSKKMTFAHNLDLDMIKITVEGNFIYFIIAFFFFKKENILVKFMKYMRFFLIFKSL